MAAFDAGLGIPTRIVLDRRDADFRRPYNGGSAGELESLRAFSALGMARVGMFFAPSAVGLIALAQAVELSSRPAPCRAL